MSPTRWIAIGVVFLEGVSVHSIRADVAYQLYSQPGDSLSATVTTDGKIGALAPSDIVSWSFSFPGNSAASTDAITYPNEAPIAAFLNNLTAVRDASNANVSHLALAQPGFGGENYLQLNDVGNSPSLTYRYFGPSFVSGPSADYLGVKRLGGFAFDHSPAGLTPPATWLFGDSAGASQNSPLLPSVSGSKFVFSNVFSGAWVDPPSASGFAYQATGGTLFTGIQGFPSGFSQAFTVTVGGTVVGAYSPGQSVTFSSPVSEFSITGISPLVDSSNPSAFPLAIDFSNPSGNSFTMTSLSSVPEPSRLVGLLGILGAGVVGLYWRRRCAA
jgi:hypothetical protein